MRCYRKKVSTVQPLVEEAYADVAGRKIPIPNSAGGR